MMKKTNISVRCWLFLVVGVIEIVLFTSNMLGWSSLLFMLKEEGFFQELCTSSNNTTGNSSVVSGTASVPAKRTCVAQEERFSLVVTLTSGIGNGATVFVGVAVDKLGAKKVRAIASLCYGLSAMLFALATKETAYLLFPATCLSQVSGTTLFFCACRASLVFGKWQSTATGLMNGANIASAITFLIFKILYENFGIAFRVLFYALMACAGLLLLNTYLLYPELDEDIDEKKKQTSARNSKRGDRETVPLKGSSVKEDLQDGKSRCTEAELPFWKLVISGGVLWSIVLMGVCRLRLWFFVASFHHFMGSQPGANESTVEVYSDIYGVAQFCAIACGPLLGLVITAGKRDVGSSSLLTRWFGAIPKAVTWGKRSTTKGISEVVVAVRKHTADLHDDTLIMAKIREIRGCQVSMICTAVTLIAFGILALIPNIVIQILTFSMLVSMRVFNQGAITNMLLVIYPTKHFGTLLGIITVTVAMICLLQHPIFIMMESCFNGQPFWANVMLLVTSLMVLGFPFYLKSYTSRLQSSGKGQRPCDTELVLRREIEVLERLSVV